MLSSFNPEKSTQKNRISNTETVLIRKKQSYY